MKEGEAICTGYISAKFEVTTAAHCIEEGSEYTLKTAAGQIFKILGTKVRRDQADMVILKIDSEGTPLELAAFDSSADAFMVAMSTKEQMLLSSSIGEIKEADLKGVLLHSYDSEPGSSGAPIIQRGKVVALHIGFVPSQDRNIAVSLNRLNAVDLEQFLGEIQKEHCTWRHPGHCITQPSIHIPSFKDLQREMTSSISKKIAGQIAGQAGAEGWTTNSCRTVGAAAILLPAATLIAPACAASGLITAGIGVPACVAAASGAIVELTCIQLCHDHQLVDCK
jgi:hypothetical protein